MKEKKSDKKKSVKRIKLRFTESSDYQVSYEARKKVQDVIGDVLRERFDDNYEPRIDVIYEFVTENIEECKRIIESWYNASSPNACLVGNLEYDEGLNRLLRLRGYQTNRIAKYNWLEKRSKGALKSFVNSICNNPDIVHRGQITGDEKDTKILAIRDFEKKAAAWYRSAEENIKKKVEDENAKIAKKQPAIGFELLPIEVKINNPLSSVVKIPHRHKNIKTLFIEDIALIVEPYLPKEIDRAKFVANVFKYFYGVPEKLLGPYDIETIGKSC